tara:strand:+ start:197 stop:385 length:189 start_codon:yes stop_codon:yes gene_type:complete
MIILRKARKRRMMMIKMKKRAMIQKKSRLNIRKISGMATFQSSSQNLRTTARNGAFIFIRKW